MLVIQQQALRDQYTLVKNSSTGQGGYADGTYLTKYTKEQDYDRRRNSSSYLNLLGPIIDARVDPCFSKAPSRTYQSNKLLEKFLEDADNNGTSLTQMIHEATKDTVTLSNSFLVMDNFNNIGDMSVEEVVATRTLPYIYSKSVVDVYSYEVDEFGKLREITFYWGPMEPSERDNQKYLFKKFTPTDIQFISKSKYRGKEEFDEKSSTVVSKNSHGFGIVPIVYHNKDVLPFSKYYAMSRQSKQLLNASSRLDELNKDQTLSILVIPGKSSEETLEIGTSNALFVDEQASNMPNYISPDSGQMTVGQGYNDSLIEKIIQSADVLGTTVVATGAATSGVQEAYRFFGKSHALMQSSGIASYLDNAVISLLELFTNMSFEYTAKYQDKFAPTFYETQAKSDVLVKVLDLNLSPVVNAQVSKDLVNIVGEFMGWSDDVLMECIDSIEVTEPLPVLEPM